MTANRATFPTLSHACPIPLVRVVKAWHAATGGLRGLWRLDDAAGLLWYTALLVATLVFAWCCGDRGAARPDEQRS